MAQSGHHEDSHRRPGPCKGPYFRFMDWIRRDMSSSASFIAPHLSTSRPVPSSSASLLYGPDRYRYLTKAPDVAGVACQSWIAKRGSHSDSGMKLCRELPCDPVYRKLVGANAARHRQPATSEHMLTQRGFRSTPGRWSRPAPKASDGADVMVENSCSSRNGGKASRLPSRAPAGNTFCSSVVRADAKHKPKVVRDVLNPARRW
jgi:hypothetical protein